MSIMTNKRDGERVKVSKSSWAKATRVFAFLKPYKFTYIVGFIFLLLSTLTGMAFPYLIGHLLGAKSSTEESSLDLTNFADPTALIVLLFIVLFAQAIFSFFRIYLFGIVTEGSLRDLKEQTHRRLIHLPVAFFDKQKVGELTSRVATDLGMLQDTFNTTIAEFVRQVLTILMSIVLIGWISPQLAGIMLATVPVVVAMAVAFGRYIKRLSKNSQDAAADSNSILSEALVGIKNVKSFANETYEIVRYKRAIDDVKNLSVKGAIGKAFFASFIILFMFGAVSFVIWQGTKLDLDPQKFNSFILFTVFLGASFGSLSSLFSNIQRAVGATERLLDLLETDPETISENNVNFSLTGDVSFDQVSFNYETRPDVEVLQNVSFETKAGETIAIVGPSGSGKSTLCALLTRFYDPTNGSIFLDGKKADELHLQNLRKQIGIVPQEVVLFSGTIADNIRYGSPECTDQALHQAAKQANILEFVERLPEGLNTLVGDRGIQLSGGQKQRIAIGRAILKNPKILILDEATSALDSEGEKLVQEALDAIMKDRTSFVIAHRLSTIRNADRILVLENGSIVEQGSHEQLINKEGLYSNMTNLQFEG